jgi:hypothetical protein
MRPVTLRPALVLALAGFLMACGSGNPASTAGPAASDGQGAAGGPDASVEAAPAPAANAELPEIVPATYQSGTAAIEVSGGRQLSAEAVLVPGASMAFDGTMLAIYSFGEGQEAGTFSVSVNLDTGPAVTLQAPNIITGGDAATGCAIEFTKSDATGVAGTFRCTNIDSLSSLEVTKVDLSGSFAAAP